MRENRTKRCIVLFLALCLMFILPSTVFAAAGSITGRVTNGTNGIAGVSVGVYFNGTLLEVVSTDTNGYYTAGGLSSGTYQVFFFGGFTGYINQWFNNELGDITSADPITVTAPNTTAGIDAVLSPGGRIVGTVTDGTNPIPNISVQIYDISSCPGNLLETTPTNLNGEYAAGGLAPGTYKVYFYSGSSGFNSEWYNNEGSCATADFVIVTDANTTPGIDAVLIPTGGLAGRVTDGTNPLPNISVQIYDDSSCPGNLLETTSTNLNGEYTVGSLPSGNYKVYFYGGSSGFNSEWYNNVVNCTDAASVPVTDPITTQSIDAVLTSQYRLLTVSTTGTGSGTVISTPSAINCGATCSTSFTVGTQVSLSENAAPGSYFDSWSGACVGNASSCPITIGDSNAVTATFTTVCPYNPVLIGGIGGLANTSIQDAYDNQAVDTDVIEIQALDLPGPLLFDKDKTVTLKGGFDCLFVTNAGQYTTVGAMTVGGAESGTGGVIIDNIIVQ